MEVDVVREDPEGDTATVEEDVERRVEVFDGESSIQYCLHCVTGALDIIRCLRRDFVEST
jgi:hypothetical protein